MPRVTITITNKQPQPYRFPLDRDDITLGRGSDNDITVQSESVSVHHAKMRRVPGGYELRDLGSTNGIKIDGERKIFVRLRSGMTVRIGEVDFFFQLNDEEQEELGKEAPEEEEMEEVEEVEEVEEAEEAEEAEEVEEVEKPKKKAKKAKKAKKERLSDDEPDAAERRAITAPRSIQASSGPSAGAILVFLLLAAIAFFVGMSLRFQKETGASLFESILSRSQASGKPSAEPEPAE